MHDRSDQQALILSDKGIREALRLGSIKIDPKPEPQQFTSSALDLRLGEDFFKWIPAVEMQEGEPPGLERPVIIGGCPAFS